MEKEKSNKGLIGVLVAVIIILLLALCYLLLGKGLLNKNKMDNGTTTTTTTTVEKENITVLASGYIRDLMTKNDAEKIKDETSYKNISIQIKDISFIFNTINVDDDGGFNYEIRIGNNVLWTYNTLLGTVGENPYIIITDNLILLQTPSFGTGDIKIFDYNGNLKYTVKNTIYIYYESQKEAAAGTTNYVTENMKIEDSKLYYNEYLDIGTEPATIADPDEVKITKKYIELNNNYNVVELDSFNGYFVKY